MKRRRKYVNYLVILVFGLHFTFSVEKSSIHVAEQCAWALGNVAGEGEELRNVLLSQGALRPLARMMLSNKGSTARTSAWALSNLIKVHCSFTFKLRLIELITRNMQILSLSIIMIIYYLFSDLIKNLIGLVNEPLWANLIHHFIFMMYLISSFFLHSSTVRWTSQLVHSSVHECFSIFFVGT